MAARCPHCPRVPCPSCARGGPPHTTSDPPPQRHIEHPPCTGALSAEKWRRKKPRNAKDGRAEKGTSRPQCVVMRACRNTPCARRGNSSSENCRESSQVGLYGWSAPCDEMWLCVVCCLSSRGRTTQARCRVERESRVSERRRSGVRADQIPCVRRSGCVLQGGAWARHGGVSRGGAARRVDRHSLVLLSCVRRPARTRHVCRLRRRSGCTKFSLTRRPARAARRTKNRCNRDPRHAERAPRAARRTRPLYFTREDRRPKRPTRTPGARQSRSRVKYRYTPVYTPVQPGYG